MAAPGAVGEAIARSRWEMAALSCQRCGAAFGMVGPGSATEGGGSSLLPYYRREHHCRRCGRKFCDDCSSRRLRLRLPAEDAGGGGRGGEAVVSSERACEGCYALLVGRAASVVPLEVRQATTLPNGVPWRMAWMFADAGVRPPS
jgi:hypothetical protein